MKTMKQERITMRIFLMCLLAVISLGACKDTKAKNTQKQSDKPYKAITVDECINEKECVWYAFSNQLGLNDYTRWTVQGKSLNKWNGDILISSVGENIPKLFQDLFLSTIEPLNRLMPIDIKTAEETKYLIVLTRNVQKSIDKWAHKMSRMPIEKQRSKNKYNRDNNIDEGCYSTTFTDKGEEGITKAITFVDVTKRQAPYCMSSHIYYVLGMWGEIKSQPFSYLPMTNTSNYGMTKLDKFLIYLLYRSEFQDGQTDHQVKKIFDGIFDAAKQEFLQIKL